MAVVDTNFVLKQYTTWLDKSMDLAGGAEGITSENIRTAKYAAEAYAETHGIGFFFYYDSLLIFITKEYAQEHEDDLYNNMLVFKMFYYGHHVVMMDAEETQTENGRTFMPDEPAQTDLVMEQLEGNLSCEKTIIISEMSSPKTEFPPGCLYKPQLQNIGWSVGATIGYALAAPQKRLVTCMTDLSFQAMKGDMSTMFKICGNSITILVNTGLYTTNVDNGYTDVIDATGKGPTELWTSEVHTKKELGIAIRKANTEEMNKLCFTEVLIPEDTMDPFCVVCQRLIVDKDDVVSYGSCNHIFHGSCMDMLLLNGDRKCPLDSSPLAGECKRWTIRTDKEVDSDDELEIDEVPARDEEEIDEADFRLALSEWFWEGN